MHVQEERLISRRMLRPPQPKQATNVAFLGEGSGGGVAMLKGNAMPAGVQVRGEWRVKRAGRLEPPHVTGAVDDQNCSSGTV